jgi:hypothetical protein
MPNDTGPKLESAGKRISSCGGSLVKLGCSGFLALFAILVAVAVLSKGHARTPPPTNTAPTPTGTSASGPLTIGSTAVLSGESEGEKLEATLLGYTAHVAGGEYDEPSAGMQYVGITLRIRNIGKVAYSDSPSNGASVLSSTGRPGKTTLLTSGECGESFATRVNIAPGEAQEGCIPFEIPEGTEVAKVQWTPSSGFSEETAEWQLHDPHAAPISEYGPGVGTGAKSCGGELDGTENISCPFAKAVLTAFVERLAEENVPPKGVSAYSSVTHQHYTLTCALVESGVRVECSTPRSSGATVSFPFLAAQEIRVESEGG